ncbi:MAG TPA: hypothetical protein DD671_08185 [Balneolaceae bacterium]|nr:hypothetical protein [Balneolaceae bacterium]
MQALLIIEGTYPWYGGGVSEWVYQYLLHLPEMEFTVLQIATDEFQGLDPDKALYPLTPNINDFIRISPPAFSSDLQKDLKAWYEDMEQAFPAGHNFDIIHVTNTGFAGFLGAHLSQDNQIPLLLTEHAIYWKEVEMGASALECGYQIPSTEIAKKHTVEHFKELARLTYQHSDQIVTVSKVNIPEQNKLGAERVEYIPNGIPETWLVDQKRRGELPTIGWVGRCAEMKNPLAFFDYVNTFDQLGQKANFTMLLCDANEPELQKKVIEKAKKFPQVTMIWNEPAEAYLSEFDILIITSHNESQPLVMLEALAKKALPVGYQVGDFTDDFGLSFSKDRSIEEQVKRISELWASPIDFEYLVDEKVKLIKEKHTWIEIFDEYRALMNRMIRKEETITF